MKGKRRGITLAAIAGGIILSAILVLGTMWMGRSAGKDTEGAVHSVSQLYLDELAGRREQVVAANMAGKIDVIMTALDLMTAEDLSDNEHLQAYQARMKKLYVLDKFAFIDSDGLIYTSLGTQDNIDE